MVIRDVSLLVPPLQEFVLLLIPAYKARFPVRELRVIETLRTKARQAELYAQGRTRPGPKVTWTLKSRHLANRQGLSEACDVGVFEGGCYLTEVQRYQEVVTIAAPILARGGWPIRNLGMSTGKDWAHWELFPPRHLP